MTSSYSLQPWSFSNEDILICVDVDEESDAEIKVPGYRGRNSFTSMDCIKVALLFFVQAKLAINPNHRFAFCTLSESSISWVRREFSSEVNSAIDALNSLLLWSDPESYEHADLSQLFQISADLAKRCSEESRILRVILIYCRSFVEPDNQWQGDENEFTLDIVYLHEKPNPVNCPDDVYDALVEATIDFSKYHGYIFHCEHGDWFGLLRYMCVLLSHPQQRCVQVNIDIPKSLA